ncbi:MAG: DUF7504 family protein [Halanaeroarchaeum sp.]
MTLDPSTVEGAASVLLLDSTNDSDAGDGTCRTLLDDDANRVGELRVVYGGHDEDVGPAPGIDRSPARRGVIVVGDEVRSAAASGGPDFSGAVTVDAVSDPRDLQNIGLSVSEIVERWDDLDRIVLCFDSLTALLDHAQPDAAFRFVHVLTTRLESADAVAHFHLDPTAHDETVVNTFGPIFDAVERVESAGESSGGTDEPFAEATDEEILERLDELDDEERFVVVDPDGRPSASAREVDEATDEDIARALER